MVASIKCSGTPSVAASLVAIAMLVPGPGVATQSVVAVRGGEIHTGTGEIISSGVILIRDGKIVSVGEDVVIPAGASIIEAGGMIVAPGIIDAHSAYGLSFSAAGDREHLLAATHRVVDGFQPPENPAWRRQGVTTVYVAPATDNLIGGFGAVVKLSDEVTVIDSAPALHVRFGENLLRRFDDRTTRQGMLAVLRQTFVRAQAYAVEPMETRIADPELEVLSEVLAGRWPLRVTVHTPDDIETIVRFAEEFDIRLVLDGASGAHVVAERLTQAQIPVVVGASILPLGNGGPFEGFTHTAENASRLQRAGVAVALGTNAGRGRSVVIEAIVAKAHGLPEAQALRAVTRGAAEILGVNDRIGSIEVGKDADLAIWRGHPLNTWSVAQVVLIDGEVVFDRRPVP